VQTPDTKQALVNRGVNLVCPESTTIGSDLNPERIAPTVTIHGGCRIGGEETSIGPGCILGEESPVTIQNCQLGQNVALKGGFFSGATLLDGVSLGSAAHVRPGTLLEEQAAGGHAVGFKQTLLMPFVTAGSLINFCDCLMAGGTGPDNHAEVGSSYVHFNFTAHQDKATASLIGDVPAGVMLDQPPIFLGGQGGLVGPTRITYGTIVAAGTICRRDILEPGKLVYGETGHKVREYPYDPRLYGNIDRVVQNCLVYVGNLHAWHAWYRDVRPLLMEDDPYSQACLAGARRRLQAVARERIKRLNQMTAKLIISLEAAGQADVLTPAGKFAMHKQFIEQWPDVAPRLELPANTEEGGPEREAFLSAVTEAKCGDYVTAIQALPPEIRRIGTTWLQGIVDRISSIWEEMKNG
jgi:bifunctional UDP-N-acetylglucosamine pyrophosphorylase/glucosamine-1-phosphate N-acetyltransferase